MARALAAEPNILLMDEPFGALDPIIRAKAQEDLLAIQRHFGTTIVLVTHDMEEAIHLGDTIAVMDKGKLLQYAHARARSSPTRRRPSCAELIGTSDRPFRLLSLAQGRRPCRARRRPTGEPIDADASLRDAYAELLWSGRAALPVQRDGADRRAA